MTEWLLFSSHTPNRNKHIGFWIVSRRTPPRDLVWHNDEVIRHSLLAFKVARQIDYLSLERDLARAHVFRIKQHDTTLVVDAAIAVVETVDRGVELVVAPDRHHHKLLWCDLVIRNLVNL